MLADATAARAAVIAEALEPGMAQREVAAELDLSRQRVQQLAAAHAKRRADG